MRKNLKVYNADKATKTYINEDLTNRRAKLFAIARSLLKRNHIKQVWTYNGNIKVIMPNGHLKTVLNGTDLKALVPDVLIDL